MVVIVHMIGQLHFNVISCVVFQNKKQRMMVRQAVLKGKDPARILEDMEIIDKMGKHI